MVARALVVLCATALVAAVAWLAQRSLRRSSPALRRCVVAGLVTSGLAGVALIPTRAVRNTGDVRTMLLTPDPATLVIGTDAGFWHSVSLARGAAGTTVWGGIWGQMQRLVTTIDWDEIEGVLDGELLAITRNGLVALDPHTFQVRRSGVARSVNRERLVSSVDTATELHAGWTLERQRLRRNRQPVSELPGEGVLLASIPETAFVLVREPGQDSDAFSVRAISSSGRELWKTQRRQLRCRSVRSTRALHWRSLLVLVQVARPAQGIFYNDLLDNTYLCINALDAQTGRVRWYSVP
jgi:hypothetical protein